MKKIWFVKHPLSLYKEDVKSMATQKGLKIVDARFKDQFDPKVVEKSPPSLTLVKEEKGSK